MKLFIPFLFALFVVPANAGIVTKIFKIEAPENKSENYEILALYDGRVFEVFPEDLQLLDKLKKAVESNQLVDLEIDGGFPYDHKSRVERIVDVSIAPVTKATRPLPFTEETQEYEPTNVPSRAKAVQMFSELLPRTKWFTQCFNRAHIWNRQMHKDHGVKSEKIFIFYTKKYRREINGKWWFHVAPMITVNNEKTVMDKEFTKEPLSADEWEAVFNVPMEREGYRCKVIDRISEYYDEANDQKEYCNIHHSSMYYWEPSELEDLEEEGVRKSDWVDWEIRAAAREIFWSWRSVYRRYRP